MFDQKLFKSFINKQAININAIKEGVTEAGGEFGEVEGNFLPIYNPGESAPVDQIYLGKSQ